MQNDRPVSTWTTVRMVVMGALMLGILLSIDHMPFFLLMD